MCLHDGKREGKREDNFFIINERTRPEVLLTKDCHTMNSSSICMQKVQLKCCGLFVCPTRYYEAR